MVQQLPSSGEGERPPPGAGCDASELLLVHAIYREDFERAVALVRDADAADAKRMRLLIRHLRALVDDLHMHHRLEDEHLWDRLEQRAPACALHVGAMRAQHATISLLLDRIAEAITAWGADPSGQREPLADAIEATRLTLVDHLGQEELQILPVAGRVLTQSEWNEMRERAMREGKPSMMMIDLDRVRQQFAAEGREDEFLDVLPTPVRLAFQLFGRRLAERHWRAIYGTAA